MVPLPATVPSAAPLTAPPRAKAKSAAFTPETLRLNTTVQETLAAFVGLAATRLMEPTTGDTRSTVYTSPVKLPLPLPLPPSLLVFGETSRTESSSTRFSPRVPLPLPALAVTVYCVVLIAATDMIDVPLSPLPTAREKSEVFTPVTASLNVTVHDTLDADVVARLPRVIDETTGGVVSSV